MEIFFFFIYFPICAGDRGLELQFVLLYYMYTVIQKSWGVNGLQTNK